MLLEHGGVTGRNVSTVQEGAEPQGFWAALGGMGEYPKESEVETASQDPRLFQVQIVPLSVHLNQCLDLAKIYIFVLVREVVLFASSNRRSFFNYKL